LIVKYQFLNLRNDYHIKSASSPMAAAPHSRTRSLLRDLANGIGQQMFFWGCDVRHAQGNLLVRAGMQRLARLEARGEGSSRYRMAWEGGLIELHSFCVGWYPDGSSHHGAIFIRGKERLQGCLGESPLTPGRYEEDRFSSECSDELLRTVRPLITWLLAYEAQVESLAGPHYRQDCWMKYLSKVGARPWLSPAQANAWFQDFLECPEKVRRPREILRRPRAIRPRL